MNNNIEEIELKYTLNTIEYIEYLVGCVLLTTIISFLTLNLLEEGNFRSIFIVIIPILIYILCHYLCYGKLEICLRNDNTIHFRWIKKAIFRTNKEKKVNINNLVKITIYEEELIRSRPYLVCQFVEKKDNFIFDIKKSSIFGNKDLVNFYTALTKYIRCINKEIDTENKIKMNVNIRILYSYKKKFFDIP